MFGPIGLKLKILYKFSSLNLPMLNEAFLEMPYWHKNIGKNKIEILPFLEELGPNFHIWDCWSKIKKST